MLAVNVHESSTLHISATCTSIDTMHITAIDVYRTIATSITVVTSSVNITADGYRSLSVHHGCDDTTI